MTNNSAQAFAGSAGISAAAAVGLGLIALAGNGGALPTGAVLGIAAAWLGSLCGSVPSYWTLRRNPHLAMSGALAGLCVRFVVTLTPALVMALQLPSLKTSLLIWTAAAQLIFLVTDTFWLVRRLQAATTHAKRSH